MISCALKSWLEASLAKHTVPELKLTSQENKKQLKYVKADQWVEVRSTMEERICGKDEF